MKKIISFLVFIILWQAIVFIAQVNPVLFPSPLQVIFSLKSANSLFIDIASSLFRLVAGCMLGIIFGIIFGIATGYLSFLNETIGCILNFFRFIPPLALVPLFLLWLGIGETSKISLILWASFFPVWVNSSHSIKEIEKKYYWVAKSLNVKKGFMIKNILFRGSLSAIMNGARIGIGIGFSVLVAAELLGAYSGLGYRIGFLQSVYRVDLMVAYIVIVGCLGMIFDSIFLKLTKKVIPWENDTSK